MGSKISNLIMLHTNLAKKSHDRGIRSHNFHNYQNAPFQIKDIFHNALLAVLPQAEEILRYDRAVGRGRVCWAYYVSASGKKIATFVSPKEFRGYWWSKDYSTTVNLATGAKYQVSSNHCTCPSWE
ncbi:MAG: hypothetical protein ACFBSE_13495, partial [Prochloraceae cyanobacterium]